MLWYFHFYDKSYCPKMEDVDISVFISRLKKSRTNIERPVDSTRDPLIKTTSKQQKQQFADILQSECSWKCHNIHWKTPVLESIFSKVVILKTATLLKRDSNAGVFQWVLRNFKKTFFIEHIWWLFWNRQKVTSCWWS